MNSHTLNLNGIWDFAYRREGSAYPSEEEFCAAMSVPGCWDDQLDRLKHTEVWSRDVSFNPDYRKIEYPLGSGKPFDTALAYLIGTGWYRRRLFIPERNRGHVIFLDLPEIISDVTVYINGHQAAVHQNHMTGLRVPIHSYIHYGRENEICLAVSNRRRNVLSCGTRGYKGFSGGIYGDVSVHTADLCAVQSVYAYPDPSLCKLCFEVQTVQAEPAQITLQWRLDNPEGVTVKEGQYAVHGETVRFSCDASGLQYWSDQNPFLYHLRIELYDGQRLLDEVCQPFGLRLSQTDGMRILLNHTPVLLRGLTEHAYYPLTCTAPLDKNFYLQAVRRFKEIGFNWIRFHTTVPPEPYLDACDELGMLVQVEAPNQFTERMWTEILLKCRRHPCVILYCGGNEVRLTDEIIQRLEWCAGEQKALAPDALFSPMHALAYADWLLEEPDETIEREPLPHNPRKMDWLRSFSDVLQPQKHIGIDCLEARWQELEPLVAFYQKPYTSHEVGIYDSYINLDLENRYEGTRIGTQLYAGAREYLRRRGLLRNAPLYYRNSCLWSAVTRKICLERIRLCEGIAGYDYLGAIDHHWHRCGYTPGILNEFYEYKPGEDRRDILRYNGESLVLLDAGLYRNLYCGQSRELAAYASVYGGSEISGALLSWRLVGESGRCYQAGQLSLGRVETHRKSFLANICFTAPELDAPQRCRLQVALQSRDYYLENEYDFWVYPQDEADSTGLLICQAPQSDLLERIHNGDDALLLHPLGMKTTPLSYAKMLAGRTIGNTATVIYDHPAMERFPHEGWCDLQFYPLMENSCSTVFEDDAPLAFDPIIETVSSYKLIFKQAALFEFSLGKGRLLVCTLNLDGSDPAQTALLSGLLTYMKSERFRPRHSLTLDEAESFLLGSGTMNLDYSQDTGLDGNAVLS